MAPGSPPDPPLPDGGFGDESTRPGLPDLGDGRYVVQASIGHGGMAEVYRALDRQLGRIVAVKLIHPDLASKPEVVRRLAREARFAASLDHPFICKVHELLERDNGLALIVMEHVDGETLKSVLKKGRPDLGTTIRIAREVAEALQYAHQRHVVHRDVKPGNIMVTPHGHIKVLDFGIAKAFGDPGASTTSTLTAEGRVVGTPAYMSPEQAAGDPVDFRSDIFSFGVVLYECLAGGLPFEGSTRTSYLHAAAVSEPKPLPRHVPAELRAIVMRCLARSPDERVESFDAVRKELDAASLSLITATSDLTFSQRLRLGPRPWVAAVAIAVTVGVVYGAIVWLRPPTDGPSQPRVQRPVVTWPSVEDGSRVSPNGAAITFVSNRDGGDRLWMRNTDGTEPRPITAAREAIKTPAWAPDSQQVAYLFQSDNQAWLDIISLWGESVGPARPISGAWDDIALVRWIGRHIYYSVSAGTSSSVLRRHNISNGVDELLTHASGKRFTVSGEMVNVDVRRDEKRLVFVADRPDRGIWTSDLDGRNAEPLPIKAGFIWTPRWKGADGRRVVYVANENGQADLWEFGFDTGTAVPLTTSPLEEEAIDLSESGQVVVADTVEQVAHLWAIDPDKEAGPAQLTNDSRSDMWPSVAIQSGQMMFHRRNGAFVTSGTMDTEILTAHWIEQRLVPGATIGPGTAGAISPDGRRLFFLRPTDPTTGELWVRDVDRPGPGRKIGDNVGLPSHDPDTSATVGQTITWESRGSEALLFVRRGVGTDAGSELIRATLTGQAPALRVVATSQGDQRITDLAISDDGGSLALVSAGRRPYRGGTVQLVDLSRPDSKPVTLLQSAEEVQLYVRGWTRRGTMVVLKSYRPDLGEKTEIWEIAGRARSRLVTVASGLRGMTARLDAARDRLFATGIQRGVFTVRMLSLTGGPARTVVSNNMEGITFAGYSVTADGWLVYMRKETNYDVWVFDFADRQSGSASKGENR